MGASWVLVSVLWRVVAPVGTRTLAHRRFAEQGDRGEQPPVQTRARCERSAFLGFFLLFGVGLVLVLDQRLQHHCGHVLVVD